MTKVEFESYIHPTYLTFETFKQAIKNAPTTTLLNVDTAIVEEVLTIDDNSSPYLIPGNFVAILLNCSNNNKNGLLSSTLSTLSKIYPQNTYPGAIFINDITPPVIPPSFVDMYSFLIIRFN